MVRLYHYIDRLNFDQHQPDYLKINPDGTIPAMVHGERVLTESTPMMEYVDDAFDGPPLKPPYPQERWRMRWWMRFFDAYFAPSLSMIGWSMFVGPAVRTRPRAELEAAMARIPLESRRIAWREPLMPADAYERYRVQGPVPVASWPAMLDEA